LHKDLIPAKYWLPSFGSATGLGNVNTSFQFEVPKGILLLEDYALGMKFQISDLPIDCILGTPFLSALEPHGSCICSDEKPGYFITMPSINGNPPKRIELPFIYETHVQIAYCKKILVTVEVFDDQINIPVTHYLDDNTPWEAFETNWIPRWQFKASNKIELGLSGFSRNTHTNVLPPQHMLGRIHQPATTASIEKLIEMGDLSRLRSANRQWFDHQTQRWEENPTYNFFQINRMRTIQDWPNRYPEEKIFDITYHQHKEMWFNVCLWTDRYKYYYCMIKFPVNFILGLEPEWLMDWWYKFGLNPVNIHPHVSETARAFLFPNRRLETIKDLFSEEEYKMLFKRERHPWVIRTKFILHQNKVSNEDPTLYREIYTQHWDPYNFRHFHDHPLE
jgi:hypothetical protein